MVIKLQADLGERQPLRLPFVMIGTSAHLCYYEARYPWGRDSLEKPSENLVGTPRKALHRFTFIAAIGLRTRLARNRSSSGASRQGSGSSGRSHSNSLSRDLSNCCRSTSIWRRCWDSSAIVSGGGLIDSKLIGVAFEAVELAIDGGLLKLLAGGELLRVH